MIEKFVSVIPMALPLICIILIAIYFAVVFKKRLTETYFLSICTIIVILFLSGILNFKGSLLLGYGIIISLSFLSLIFIIKRFLKNKKIFKEIYLFPSLIVFFLFVIFALFINYGRMFIHWDEFSHWGIAVKNMYVFDALGSFKDSTIMFKTYLPGTSLFQYFFVRPYTEFVEFPTYIAFNMLFFSIISTFIEKFNLKSILITITSLLIPLLMGMSFYNALYVDCFLGVLFGSIFLFYYKYKYEQTVFGIMTVTAAIGLLTLTKDIGFVLSGIALLIICLDTIFFRMESIKKYFHNAKTFPCKAKAMFLLVFPICVTILIQFLWKLNITITNVTSVWNTSNISITNLITGNLLPYQKETLNLFIQALVHKPIAPFSLSFIKILSVIFVITTILSLILKKKDVNWKRLLFTYWEIVVCSTIYLFALLLFYLFIIWDYEALFLASYERYVLSYIIGLCFSLLLFLILDSDNSHHKKIKKGFFYYSKIALSFFTVLFTYGLLLFYTIPFIKTDVFNARESANNTLQIRKPYDLVTQWSKYFSNKDKKIYIISQGSTGLDKLILIYTTYPNNITMVMDYSVSLTAYYPELKDPWTKIIDTEDWAKYVIKNYDYVYLFKIDDNFSKLYGKFFDKIDTNILYKVTIGNNGELSLITQEKQR